MAATSARRGPHVSFYALRLLAQAIAIAAPAARARQDSRRRPDRTRTRGCPVGANPHAGHPRDLHPARRTGRGRIGHSPTPTRRVRERLLTCQSACEVGRCAGIYSHAERGRRSPGWGRGAQTGSHGGRDMCDPGVLRASLREGLAMLEQARDAVCPCHPTPTFSWRDFGCEDQPLSQINVRVEASLST
jgi:hypothetical protein